MRSMLFVLLLTALVYAMSNDESIVHTSLGDVHGLLFDTHREFLGIPYIQPPVGELRFARPVPAKSWSPSMLEATKFKPGCPQQCILPPGACPEEQSEDCIYLNIYTPRVITQKLPVIFWIPGGHFEQGSAGTILYDGQFIVTNQSQIIFVTMNYRLGALGWMTDDSIAELEDGNLGLMDQIEALHWIQRNIENFGGNKDAVTIAGQSAGAISVAALLISPKTKGLFHRAISQSNPLTLPFRYKSDASYLGREVRRILGCNDIACLRAKPIQDIIKAQHEAADKILIFEPIVSFLPWTPTVDKKLVPSRFLDAVENDLFQKDKNGAPIPIIYGSVSEEAVIFVYMGAKNNVTEFEYVGAIIAFFGTSAFGILERYPPVPIMGDKRPQLAVLVTDYLVYCVNRYVAGLWQTHGKGSENVYLYRFNHALSFDAWSDKYSYCRGHVCHGAELPVLLRNGGNFTFSEQEKRLSAEMATYWTNFAWTANPNVRPKFLSKVNLPQWPAFNASEPAHLEFASNSSYVIKNLKKEHCDYFDQIGYKRGTGQINK